MIKRERKKSRIPKWKIARALEMHLGTRLPNDRAEALDLGVLDLVLDSLKEELTNRFKHAFPTTADFVAFATDIVSWVINIVATMEEEAPSKKRKTALGLQTFGIVARLSKFLDQKDLPAKWYAQLRPKVTKLIKKFYEAQEVPTATDQAESFMPNHVKALSMCGSVIALALGQDVGKVGRTYTSVAAMSKDLNSLVSFMLWEVFQFDMDGSHALDKIVLDAQAEASNLLKTPSQKVTGHMLETMETWTRDTEKLLVELDKDRRALLVPLVHQMREKTSVSRTALELAGVRRPAPLLYLLYSEPGLGKTSFIQNCLVPSLSKAMDLAPQFYNLNSGKYLLPYFGESFAVYDEFGAKGAKGEGEDLSFLNAICSSLPAPIPGARLETKDQIAKFDAVFLASNLDPHTCDFGMTPAVKEAFMSRAILVRVMDYNIEAGKFRHEAQTHRKPNYSHLTFKVEGTTAKYLDGPNFVAFVGKQLHENASIFTAATANGTNNIIAIPSFAKAEEVPLDSEVSATTTVDNIVELQPPQDERPFTQHNAERRSRRNHIDFIPNITIRGRRWREHRSASVSTGASDREEGGIANSVCVFSGPPGLGKTLTIYPYAEAIASNEGRPITALKSLSEDVKPGSIVVIDDLIDPTTPEGQADYNKWFDRNEQKGLHIIIISNFGPGRLFPWFGPGWLSKALSWFRPSPHQYCRAYKPAFARRFVLEKHFPNTRFSVGEALGCVNYFSRENTTLDAAVTYFLTGQRMPLEVFPQLPTVMPFTQAQADIWYIVKEDGQGQPPSHAQMFKEALSCAKPHLLHKAMVFQPLVYCTTFEQFVTAYKRILAHFPNLKVCVRFRNQALVGDGSRMWLGSGFGQDDVKFNATNKSVTAFALKRYTLTSEIWYALRCHENLSSIDPAIVTLYFRWKIFMPHLIDRTDKLLLSSWQRFGLVTAKVKRNFEKFVENTMASNTRLAFTVLAIGVSFSILLGMTKGGKSTSVPLCKPDRKQYRRDRRPVEKFPMEFLQPHCTKQFLEDAAEGKPGKKKGMKLKLKVQRHKHTPLVSGEDSLGDLELDDPGYADFMHYNSTGKIEVLDNYTTDTGDRMYRLQFPNSITGKPRIWTHNVSRNELYGYDKLNDREEAYHMEVEAGVSTSHTFRDKLRLNIVGLEYTRSDGLPGSSYATMLTQNVGVAPLHTLRHGPPKVKWYADGLLVTSEATVFYQSPDQELGFFRTVKKGPFSSLYDHLLSEEFASNHIQSGTLVHVRTGPDGKAMYEDFTSSMCYQATPEPAFDTAVLADWKYSVGLLYYGRMDSPTAPGSCGSPVFTTINGKSYLVSVHAASRRSQRTLASAVIFRETWNAAMQALRQKDVAEDSLDNPVELVDWYIEGATRPVKVLKRHLTLVGPPEEGGLVPHGPHLLRSGCIRKARKSDTNGTKNMIFPPCGKAFTGTKVPTVTETEALERFPERILPDAEGKKKLGYTRLSRLNTIKKTVDMNVTKAAIELASALIKETDMGHLEPLTADQAIAGGGGYEAFSRKTSAGVYQSIVFGHSQKSDMADFDNDSRTVYWKDKCAEKVMNTQWKLAKKGVRLHMPANAGLKSELLPEEKLHKKRVFMVVPAITALNQKRLLAPIQRELCKTLGSRFTLSLDARRDWDEWMKYLEGYNDFASWDFSSFDLSVPAPILAGVAEVCAQFYIQRTHGGKSGHKLAEACRTMIDETTNTQFTYDQTLLTKQGGVLSGMGCTSLVDSLGALLTFYLVIRDIVDISATEFLENFLTRGAGDDLVTAISDKYRKVVKPRMIVERYDRLFGMTITAADKTGEVVEDWTRIEQVNFCSRTFERMHRHPALWVSKLKEASLKGAAQYSASSDPTEQLEQLKGVLEETIAYGEDAYETLRKEIRAFCKFHKLDFDCPSYDEALEEFAHELKCKDERTEFSIIVSNSQIEVPIEREYIPRFTSKKELKLEKELRKMALLNADNLKEFLSSKKNSFHVEPDYEPFECAHFHPTYKLGRPVYARDSDDFWRFLANQQHKALRTRAQEVADAWKDLQEEEATNIDVYWNIKIARILQHVLAETPEAVTEQEFRDLQTWSFGLKEPKILARYADDVLKKHVDPDSFIFTYPWNKGFGFTFTPSVFHHGIVRVLEGKALGCQREFTQQWVINVFNKIERGVRYTKKPVALGNKEFDLNMQTAYKKMANEMKQLITGLRQLCPDEDKAESGVETTMPLPVPSAGTGSSGAMQDFSQSNATAASATATMPPALSGGAAQQAAPVLETLGGMDSLLLPRGAFMDSMLAPCYKPTPLATVSVGTSTVEGTILYSARLNPWDEASTGIWINKWASLHKRFTGSLEYTLEVASSGTMIGKIALYYTPDAGILDIGYSRGLWSQFQHVIVDLQQPSSQKLVLRLASHNSFYAIKGDLSSHTGSLYMVAYTDVQNTFGTEISPPVILSCNLGPDAMYVYPGVSKDDVVSAPPPSIPPGQFLYTDGHNAYRETRPAEHPFFQPRGDGYYHGFVPHTVLVDTDKVTPRNLQDMTVSIFDVKSACNAGAPGMDYNLAMREYFGDAVSNTLGDIALGAALGPVNINRAEDPRFPGISAFTAIYESTRPEEEGKPSELKGTYRADKIWVRGTTYRGVQQMIYTAASSTVKPSQVDYVPSNPEWQTQGKITGQIVFEDDPNAELYITENHGMEEWQGYIEKELRCTGAKIKLSREPTEGELVNIGYVGLDLSIRDFGTGAGIKPDGSWICRSTPPTNGDEVPPGYLLVGFAAPGTVVGTGTLSAVLPNTKGLTHIFNNDYNEFMMYTMEYLRDNKLKSYTARGTTTDGSTSVHLLFNSKGIFIRQGSLPSYGVAFTVNDIFTWTVTGRHSVEFPPLPSSTNVFVSRNAGLSDGRSTAKYLAKHLAIKDVAEAGLAGATIFGGLLGGLGAGLGQHAQMQQQLAMQSAEFAQQWRLQDKGLKAQLERQRINNAAQMAMQTRRLASQTPSAMGTMTSAHSVPPVFIPAAQNGKVTMISLDHPGLEETSV